MNRHALLAGVAAATLVLPAGMSLPAVAASGWAIVDDYASESGDSYYTVERNTDGRVRFRVNIAAEYYSATDICVRKVRKTKKSRWVCHTVKMKATGPYGAYTGSIKWQGRYPSKGSAKRRVRFGGRGGVKLGFKP